MVWVDAFAAARCSACDAEANGAWCAAAYSYAHGLWKLDHGVTHDVRVTRVARMVNAAAHTQKNAAARRMHCTVCCLGLQNATA